MHKNEMGGDGEAGPEGKSELESLLSKQSRRSFTDEDLIEQPVDLKRLYISKDFREFTWRRHKPQLRFISGSFTALFLVGFLTQILQQQPSFPASIPLALCISLSLLLLYLVCFDFENSRRACQAISPALLLLGLLAWDLPNFVLSDQNSQSSNPQELVAIFFISSSPLLLCCAPIMGLQVSCTLAGLLLSVYLSAGIYTSGFERWHPVKSSFSLAPIVLVSSMVLSYQSQCSEKELFTSMNSLRRSLSFSKRSNSESRLELENVKRDSTEKIAKMRQFISYIFHEIRVPFNAVVLGIGHLLATNVSEDQQEVLKMMDSSSSSMIRILNDVLDMGKIESGKLQLEKQPFNLAELVSSLIWAFKDTLESKGLDFLLCVDECTKEFLSLHDLLGDKHRIRQVLANYLSNATKFTPRGGKVKLHVVWNRSEDPSAEGLVEAGSPHPKQQEILEQQQQQQQGARKRFASVTISVEDTGIGISKEDQSRLFEPYMQVQPGSHGGTGLGLSFAKRIVELAGGKIGVFSDTGRGSVFSFTVPFEVAGRVAAAEEVLVNPFDLPAGAGAESPGSAPSSLSCNVRKEAARVLIVEDNQVNRRILKKLLASFKIDSDAVEDGQQAVDLCRSGAQYDMILIDKEMPVMDGHEATREIRAMGVKTTIVGLTGNALDSDRNQFLAAGVNDFFTKPLSRHQLLRLLEAHGLVNPQQQQQQKP